MKDRKRFIKYWEERIANTGNNIRAVGHKGFTNRENEIIYKAKFNILDKIFKKIGVKNKKVLDAGCGIGIFAEYYDDKDAKIYVMDASPTAVKITKKKIPSIISSKVSPLDKIPYKDNFFDIIHCFDVLYHIIDDKTWEFSLNEFSRVLKKGGYLIISEFWKNNSKRLKKHVKIRSKSKYVNILNSLKLKSIAEYELYLLLQKNYFLTKLCPRLCLQLESLFKYPLFKRFFGAKVILIKKY